MKLTLDAAQTIVSRNLEEARETAKYDHRTSEYWPTLVGERLWFLNMLNNIEAEPVKHGRWKHHQYGNTAGYYECDNCGKINAYKSDYCPKCGTRMDGEEDG